jgi:hypothetical protein
MKLIKPLYKNEICYRCGKTNDEQMSFFARKNQFDDKRVEIDIFLCCKCYQAWSNLEGKKFESYGKKEWEKAWFDLFFDVFMKEKIPHYNIKVMLI